MRLELQMELLKPEIDIDYRRIINILSKICIRTL